MPESVVYLMRVNGQPPVDVTQEIKKMQAKVSLLEKKVGQATTSCHLAISAEKSSEIRQNMQRALDYLYETRTITQLKKSERHS